MPPAGSEALSLSCRSTLAPISLSVDQANDTEKFRTGGNPVASGTTLVVLAGLLSVERIITRMWNVPRWSIFAFVILVIALAIQRLLARSQPGSAALRPLTLTSLAVAVVLTVLVVLSDTPSDRWLLLAWVVPLTTTLADRIAPRLPARALVLIVSGLLAVVVTVQLGFIWQDHRAQARATTFHERLDRICDRTASISRGGTLQWIVANESMLAEIETVTPPDERTRKLTSYLVIALRGAETSMKLNDNAKQLEWQQMARQVAGYLGINRSCGVF